MPTQFNAKRQGSEFASAIARRQAKRKQPPPSVRGSKPVRRSPLEPSSGKGSTGTVPTRVYAPESKSFTPTSTGGGAGLINAAARRIKKVPGKRGY